MEHDSLKENEILLNQTELSPEELTEILSKYHKSLALVFFLLFIIFALIINY